MRTLIFIITAGFLSIVLAANSQAALVLQPAGLNPGDQYRLVFVTSTARDATSSNIADYNDHVQAAADASPTVNSWGLTWKAIGSTFEVHARDNTSTDPLIPGIPIYLVDGTNIADNYADLWDGDIDGLIRWTELDANYSGRVWTGTTVVCCFMEEEFVLGRPLVFAGVTTFADDWWANFFEFSSSQTFPLYGISGVITAVPEPNALLYIGLVVFGWVARRRVLNPTKK